MQQAALALALGSSQLVAETSHSQHTQDNVKIKVKDDRVIARDKSKPVRRALDEQYAKIAEAQRNEDIEALRATRTPISPSICRRGRSGIWTPP